MKFNQENTNAVLLICEWPGNLPIQAEFSVFNLYPLGQFQCCRAERLTKPIWKTTDKKATRKRNIILRGFFELSLEKNYLVFSHIQGKMNMCNPKRFPQSLTLHSDILSQYQVLSLPCFSCHFSPYCVWPQPWRNSWEISSTHTSGFFSPSCLSFFFFFLFWKPSMKCLTLLPQN